MACGVDGSGWSVDGQWMIGRWPIERQLMATMWPTISYDHMMIDAWLVVGHCGMSGEVMLIGGGVHHM